MMLEAQTLQKPDISRLALAILTVLIAAVCMTLRLTWIEPLPVPVQPKGWLALPFALLFGFGVAVVLCLGWANRHRWRVVLGPNRGRIIGAFVLGFVTPGAVFSWVPWIFGSVVLTIGLQTLNNGGDPVPLAIGLGLLILPAALWYPVACLIVSGIKSRWVRVAVFTLMFWTAYSAAILMMGTQRFML